MTFTNHRLRTALMHKNSSILAQSNADLLHCFEQSHVGHDHGNPRIILWILDMCRSTSHIDIGTVRLIANHICFGTKCIKHTLCSINRTSVEAIQPHAHAIVRSGSQRNQIADVTVPSDRIIPEILYPFPFMTLIPLS